AIGVGSDADRYARVVASTAYLAVGDNAPMLDPALSEGSLSLLPNEGRWAISARFSIGAEGRIGEVAIEAAAVRSVAQLSYDALEAWLAGDRDAIHLEADAAAEVADGVLTAAVEASRRLGVE